MRLNQIRERLADMGKGAQAAFDRRFRKAALYRRVYNTADGRAVLADMAKFACYDRPCHVPGDPYSTAFNDGVKRPLVRVRRFLHMTEDEMFRLAQEVAEDD